MKTALEVKGCALFLVNRRSEELELAAAFGLSRNYLNKGPVSAIKSIAATFRDGPVAIAEVADDPRIQYPAEARKEGIASILSVPMIIHGNAIGALRIYTATPAEFTIDDVTFAQAIAQLAALAIDSSRLRLGLKNSIEILKTMRDPKKMPTGMAAATARA